jgi:hypothetical protein
MKTADYRTAKVLVRSHDRARRLLDRIQREGTKSLPASVVKIYWKYGITLATTFEAGLLALEEKLGKDTVERP